MSTSPTLAQLIRQKFPDSYNDMSDTELETNVLQKHPEYGDLPRSTRDQAAGNIQKSAQAMQPVSGSPLEEFTNSPQFQDIRQGNLAAWKLGTDTLAGQTAMTGPVAKAVQQNVLPALKAVPWVGRAVSAIDEAPGTIGKVIRGATVGGAGGGVEGLIRGKPGKEIAKDAGKGALWGGALGGAIPAISRLAGPPPETPGVYPGASQPSSDEFYAKRGAEINSMRKLQPDAFKPPEPEPQLGSPENPGFMSKLPARLPPNLRSDPFSPSAEPSEVAPGVEPPTAKVTRLPVPRDPMPGENPNNMGSIPRKRLTNLALQGRPGAGQQLQNIGQTPIYVPESYPPPRERLPWDQQGASTPFSAPLETQTDSLGVRWASDGANKVSIPRGVPLEQVEAYARPKLAEQAQIRGQLPWLKGR